MSLRFHESPFHVTHPEEVASKMAMKVDLSIMLSKLINDQGWTQDEAAKRLEVQQSRISDLKNAKIEKFTIDAMLDMLDKMGFHAAWTMPSMDEARISIKRDSAA